MNKILTVAGLIAIITFANNATGAPGAEDLIKMARSGVDEAVLSSYIETAADTFGLSAEDIITLKDLGVSSKVITQALRHDHDIDSLAAREEIKSALTSDTAAASPVVSSSAAVVPPTDKPDISFFYESLYPYGNWLEVDGQWCWQPSATVIDAEWAPYCNRGHWVYSDWGWCWVSDYSWGWAPFHYGRWFRHNRYGWCWVPDNEWGPAWVAWRRSDEFCGWAPLPPRSRYVRREGFYFGASLAGGDFEFKLTFHDYHFVPAGHFCDPHPWVHMVPSARAEETFKRTTFVRNSYDYENDHIVNRGVPVADISRSLGKRVETIAIVNDRLAPGQPIHRGIVRENKLVIYKPVISSAVSESPAAMKIRIDHHRPQKFSGSGLTGRERSIMDQTAKKERAEAETAQREKKYYATVAKKEPDSKKRAVLEGEEDVRAMRMHQAENHVANIKKWSPQPSPAALPQSKVVPQPSPENREQVRMQVKSQVQREAQDEQLRQKESEDIVRTSRTADQPTPASPRPNRRNNQDRGR